MTTEPGEHFFTQTVRAARPGASITLARVAADMVSADLEFAHDELRILGKALREMVAELDAERAKHEVTKARLALALKGGPDRA